MLLALLLQAAAPAPVYLKCSLDTDATAAPMDVQLNEPAGTASYSFVLQGRQLSYTVRAIYTADQVAFNGFTINRSDLTFARQTTGFLAEVSGRSNDTGKCVINQTKRAF